MSGLIVQQLALAPDFAWSQSAVNTYLECPRAFLLKHIERRPLDQVAAGFAGPLGTGTHAGIAAVLQAATLGNEIPAYEVRKLMLAAFGEAITRSQKRGEVFDDEGVQAAMEKLDGERLDWVLALERDPRVRAIEWTAVEERFDWLDPHGRKHQGTIDAFGHARSYVDRFASRGKNETSSLEEGTPVVVDWKSGEIPIDHVSRTLCVQLAYYTIGLARKGLIAPGTTPRAFLARLPDIVPPKKPKDENGEAIPRTFEDLNPAWVAAAGLQDLPLEEQLKANKKPRDPATKASISKWLERTNPAWVAATSKPRGPVFHECEINFPLATRTITDVIRGAEAGFFPASGAATGQCLSCAFRRTCLESTSRGTE